MCLLECVSTFLFWPFLNLRVNTSSVFTQKPDTKCPNWTQKKTVHEIKLSLVKKEYKLT